MTAIAPDSYVSPSATQQQLEDQSIYQLLNKLDEGLQTVSNLRSILALKTSELNELLGQLELTQQAIHNVEQSTEQIENILKGLGLTEDGGEGRLMLLDAEASLDKAIRSATDLYSRQPTLRSTHTRTIRPRTDTKSLVRQINQLLRELDIDADTFFKTVHDMDDTQALQKIKNKARHNPMEIVTLSTKIRESVRLWRTYVQDAPMRIDGKDILEILDAQDALVNAKYRESPPPPLAIRRRKSIADLHATSPRSPTTHSRTSSLHAGLPTTTNPLGANASPTTPVMPAPPVPRRVRCPAPPPLGLKLHPATSTRPVIKAPSVTRTTKRSSSPQKTKMTSPSNKANLTHPDSCIPILLKKPATSTSKPPVSRGPGSTLRLRNMLSKRTHLLPHDITA
ncbi:hypothetical protein BX666DRAFT_223203 [Dichotomocladium elegans]|nr:hypothetical protein BX666DRAFT_223203 [Dichotomocladium elegans]